MRKNKEKKPSESFVMGVVALVFLVIGYQVALFLHRAAVLKIEANRDVPDTVYVYKEILNKNVVSPALNQDHQPPDVKVVRKIAAHSAKVTAVRENLPRRKVESFRFDPNTVSHDDLCRLGFSSRQAHSIISYRQKGGRFRRKSDFAKSYVVADSVYARLESFIDIPLLDLNLADSADFDALPGIGGWFASRIVEYRAALKGYSYKEQLMDIRKFDRQKFDALSDLVEVDLDNVTSYPLWTYPADSLRNHPYIKNYETARAIVLFRENTPCEKWSVAEMEKAGILSSEYAGKLSRCKISNPVRSEELP
jgi:DNA uptake protein ComE-like DNA-binding protein